MKRRRNRGAVGLSRHDKAEQCKAAALDDLLVQACRTGDLAAAQAAVSQGATKACRGFLAACEAGHLSVVHYMVGILCLRLWGVPWFRAMERACVGRHRPVIDYILAHGGKTSSNGWSLVDYGLLGAAEGGHLDLVRDWLHHNAQQVVPAFEVACEAGHWTVAQELLDRLPPSVDLALPLCAAIRKGQFVVVEHLLRLNVPLPTDLTDWRFTRLGEFYLPLDALINAYQRGDVALVALLRTHGATYVHLPSVYFEYACRGSWEAVEDVMNHFPMHTWDWSQAVRMCVRNSDFTNWDHTACVIAELVHRGAKCPPGDLRGPDLVVALLNAGVPLDWFPKRLRLTRRSVAYRIYCANLLAQHCPLYDALNRLVDAYVGNVIPPPGPLPYGTLPLRRSARHHASSADVF